MEDDRSQEAPGGCVMSFDYTVILSASAVAMLGLDDEQPGEIARSVRLGIIRARGRREVVATVPTHERILALLERWSKNRSLTSRDRQSAKQAAASLRKQLGSDP